MNKLNYLILTLLASTQALAYNFNFTAETVGKAKIIFAKNADTAETSHFQHIDFAQLEKEAPLSQANLAGIKADDLRSLDMEHFNQIYARLNAGPMPLGDYSGYILQKSPIFNEIKKRILKQAKYFSEFLTLVSKGCGRESEDCLFEFIWKGKRFLPKNEMDQIQARTTVNVVSSAFSKFTPSIIKNLVPNSIGKAAVGLADDFSFTGLPMNVYCGISQVDTRKESIIADGSFGDDFTADYSEIRDQIVTRKGLNISEEYRLVRPGLYIGKAYSNKLFLFNIALEISGATPTTGTVGTCFDGTTTR